MPSDQGDTTVVRTIGRYRISGELGRGAMGVVFRGFDPVIGRTVALKTLRIDTADPQAREFRSRLYREAAAAGALSHPNIVTIFDVIEEGGVTAVAMEFIEGRPLSVIIAERAPLPLDLALEVLDQVCSALDYAGSQGIVHRDIKPANILVTSAGRVKVTDFGVARLALSTMTQAGTVLGSPSYMSPEQVKGLSLDGRSDLFSAAVVFFEMITRERPFAGNDVATTMYRIAHEPPTPPTKFNPAIGPEVAAALERAFAKSPPDRFQTGADLAAALRAAAPPGGARGSSHALAGLASAPPPVPPIVTPAAGGPAPPATRKAAPHESMPLIAAMPTGPAPTDSGGQPLAPIPGARPASLEAEASPVTSDMELPPIPLPAEAAAPPLPPVVVPSAEKRPSVARAPRLARRRGLALAGAVGVAVVALGVAVALYLRGGGGLAGEQPAETAIEPPPLESAAFTGPMMVGVPAVPPTAAPLPPAPPSADARVAGRAPAGPSARKPAAPQPAADARPLPDQSVPVAPPSGVAAPPTPAVAAPARAYQTTEVDVKPEVLTQVAPNYPDEVARQRVQDIVILQVLVDAAGKPQNIKLLRGSRKAPLLDGAAAAAVRQWTFSPARKNGQPVPCWYNVGVPFPPAK
jgi:serine/threonine-protein kinase